MRVRSAVLCPALVAGTVLLGTPAAAAGVACGDVVVGEVTLTADLVCPGSPVGLALADGATLDLGGHRVVGDGTGTGITVPGLAETTVRGGVVTGWAQGLAVVPGDATSDWRYAMLDGLRLEGNDVGLSSTGEYPVALMEVTASQLVGNRVGLLASDTGWISFEGTDLTDNVTGMSAYLSIVGITHAVIARNATGVQCGGASCSVRSSTVADNGTALTADPPVDHHWYLSLAESTLTGNDVGVDARAGRHGWVEVFANVIQHNGTAVTLRSTRGEIGQNRFLDNGIGYVDDGTGDTGETTVRYNEFRRNGHGILSVSPGTAVEANFARNNHRWGIHAPGAVDLGDNTARGNGRQPQCVGVVCNGPGPVS